MINALRQRPDIMLVGEVRTKKDAETLFEAIHTGHSVYGTVHADNAQDTIIRMTNPPIDVPKITMNAIGGGGRAVQAQVQGDKAYAGIRGDTGDRRHQRAPQVEHNKRHIHADQRAHQAARDPAALRGIHQEGHDRASWRRRGWYSSGW
jgi:Flp pilus assembly CpaF family ATPase